nr:adenosylcobinamide amidohydrolase [Actinoplanes lichenicola]
MRAGGVSGERLGIGTGGVSGERLGAGAGGDSGERPGVEAGGVSAYQPGMGAGTARPAVGTVNIVAWVPVRLSDGALVNAVATVTEAKAQAIRALGLEATGTATDAVCVLCPVDGPVAAYAGPRSTWGAPLARAVYAAVLDGGAVNLAGTQSWSDRVSGT